MRARREDGRFARATAMPPTLGRYRLVTELGRGSTSIVFLAAVDGPADFNKLFAVKRLRPALAENPTFVRMFLAEARVGAQLNHPNVVSTLEIDETDALPYIVMDYLDGQPLQKLLATAAGAFLHLPLHMHLAALSGALEGLAHAHDAREPDGRPLQIVHRDVSPHNVFVTSNGTPKLLDFGCAQTAGAPWTIPTSAGHAAYMSPEQASGDPVDARSDLFSVGVMLWEAIARRRFWPDTATKSEILSALASGALPTTRLTGLANAPPDLRSMALKATAPDPAGRYDRAASLQADLQRALRRITPPTFELRELGQRLTTVFAAERARMQVVINEQQRLARTTGERVLTSRHEGHPGRRSPVSSVPPAQIVSLLTNSAIGESEPLPSFPLPDFDRPEGRTQRTAWTIVALAGSALIGAAVSTVHATSTHSPPASAATTIAVPETAPIVAAVEGPRESDPPVASAGVAPPVAAPSSVPPPPARKARSSPPAAPRGNPGVVVIPAAAVETPPAPVHGPHPIDSVNPYGP